MDKVIDNQRIICGDVIKELMRMPNESVSLIVTDPPYNLNKNYGKSQDKLEFDEYINFSKKWLSEAKRILKPNGTIYVFMGMRSVSYTHLTLPTKA